MNQTNDLQLYLMDNIEKQDFGSNSDQRRTISSTLNDHPVRPIENQDDYLNDGTES